MMAMHIPYNWSIFAAVRHITSPSLSNGEFELLGNISTNAEWRDANSSGDKRGTKAIL